ncbi:MAG TPA: lamin tail domain-containing protein [Pyrinomonadaceae bacterium]|jgi:hypothetical protein
MHYLIRSRSALAFVCAVACLFFFYATSTPLRRVIAHEERRAAERRQSLPQAQSDVPADLRAAIEKMRADEGREVRPQANDAGAQYPLTVDPFMQQQRLHASDAATGDDFGYSIAISGDTAIIGAPLDDNSGGVDAGSAYIFTRSAGVWSEQQRLQASDAAPLDGLFNTSVAISGDTAILGVSEDKNSGGERAGSVYVFTRSAGVWSEQQRLQASNAQFSSHFGSAISISGETMLIGAASTYFNGVESGTAYIFTRSAGVWRERQQLQASDAALNDDFGASVALSGDTAIIGAPTDKNSAGFAGSAYVFTRSADVWDEQQRLQASDASSGDHFGQSVSISDESVLIGAYFDDNSGGVDAGSAYIFTRSAGVWSEQQRLQASDAAYADLFGNAVSISGDVAVIGSFFDDTLFVGGSGGTNAGSAYIFTRSGGVWSERQRLEALNGDDYSPFGVSVVISGDTVMVGAAPDSFNGGPFPGSVYVYNMGPDRWGEQQQLQSPESASGDYFGYSVAISGDTAVVVATGEDDDQGVPIGAAYFFNRCAGVWSLQQRLHVSADNGHSRGLSFQSVAISGNTAIVGAEGQDENAGAAYVLTRSRGVWSQQQRLKASDAVAQDRFGVSVSISGDTAIIGAYADDNSGAFNAGSAYVFTRSAGLWSEQQRLQASDAAGLDYFGWSVAVSGDTALVGAERNDNSNGADAGAAYLFTRSGGVWGQQQKLLPITSPGYGHNFGYSVAISGETAIIGAYGDHLDNVLRAGAAYVFTKRGVNWHQQQRLRASVPATDDFFGGSVAISGETVIVGALIDDNSGGVNAGSAYVFTRSGGIWSEQRRLQASDAAAHAIFGSSVSISGDTAIVGAFAHSGPAAPGAAYIFGTPPPASLVLISEFRLAGPGVGGTSAGTDEFVELYNNTDADITVGTTDGSAGWTLRSSDGTLNFTIPNGDVIPARGHYLLTNSDGYSLAPYPTSQHGCAGGNCAHGNRTFASDTPENTGLALFRTANAANFTLANRLDAAGAVTEADALYREGEGYTPVSGSTATVQHSLVRNLLSGTPRDCDHRDFQLVATDGAATLPGAVLGAPAPENTNSPVQRNASLKASLLDTMQPSSVAPNRVRSGAADPSEPANSTRGTLKIRRKFTNATGAAVTRLRFRVADITTTPRRNSATADLRVLSGAGGVNVSLSNGASVPLIALTREEPPAQSAHGGGLNTTLSATLAQAIPHKASIYVEFNLGVIEDGNFSFHVNVEALTNPPTDSPANSKPDALRKASKSMKAGTPPATP